ncbi:hypothetical protein BDV26DRAFT_295500 [Aspergillus bertholletiae]|uniref:NAD(P)-binding domain-containing protein n=1 Tax=Aspergillus bertholletiae TaxID=1226010 RepID=A0A5N7AYX9_9EURO|nr:hypothetical protein BDV26DRAFT_295500 [Aspergillus bertholletiae]
MSWQNYAIQVLSGLAGIGGVAKYLLEELPKEGHQVAAITRSQKPLPKEIIQHITDYSVSHLTKILQDCDAVISCITAHSPDFLDVHLSLLEACKISPKCKRFLPSAWSGNYEEVRDQPLFAGGELEQIYNALRIQSEIKWTLFCQGWMADYLVPSSQRYLDDLGERWVQDYERKTFTLYGNQWQQVDFTAARDAARAVAVLFNHDANDWEEFTCVSGQRLSWRELWEFVKTYDPAYEMKQKSVAQSIKQLMARENDASVAAAMYEIMGNTEALAFPEGKVDRHRQKYFQGLKFRTLAQLVKEAKDNPGKVI